jgi:hypothetical protein
MAAPHMGQSAVPKGTSTRHREQAGNRPTFFPAVSDAGAQATEEAVRLVPGWLTELCRAPMLTHWATRLGAQVGATVEILLPEKWGSSRIVVPSRHLGHPPDASRNAESQSMSKRRVDTDSQLRLGRCDGVVILKIEGLSRPASSDVHRVARCAQEPSSRSLKWLSGNLRVRTTERLAWTPTPASPR